MRQTSLTRLCQVVGVISLGTLFIWGVHAKWQRMPNLAEHLPADTQAFSVVNTEKYPGQLPFESENKWSAYTWQNNEWQPYEASSKGPHLIDESDYQNVRNRLSYEADAFVYMEPADLDTLIVPWLNHNGFSSAHAWLQVLQRIPALGFTLDFRDEYWYGEGVAIIDKEQLSTGQFYHAEERYEGNLLAYAPQDTEILIGGQDLERQWEVLQQHLQDIQPDLDLSGLLPAAPKGEYLLVRKSGEWSFVEAGDSRTPMAYVDKLLPGSDLFVQFQVENVDNMSIMVRSGIKLFDDGLATRHVITFE